MKSTDAVLTAPQPQSPPRTTPERETLLRLMAAAAFLIFFQSYLVAPLIPALSREFHSWPQRVGLLVPAYLLPYGFSTLFYGPLSDRFGRRPVLLTLLALVVITSAGAAAAATLGQLVAWRVVGGIASGGIVPIGLALLGDLFPFEQRGRPLGWIFGAIAGGSAFGSTFGAMLYPLVGWRPVFLALAVINIVLFIVAWRHRAVLDGSTAPHPLTPRQVASTYLALLTDPRGGRTYAFIFCNGIFHSGLFAWLGFYFSERFHLGEIGIGLALLGYGVPGLLLGPVIGRLADRMGRRAIIPAGIALAAVSAAGLAPHAPLLIPALLVTLLSLGFDMSHPLLAGIITSLDARRRGAAMGFNAFVLFTGFGLGSLAFGALLHWGFGRSLLIFATAQIALAALALRTFRGETSQAARSRD